MAKRQQCARKATGANTGSKPPAAKRQRSDPAAAAAAAAAAAPAVELRDDSDLEGLGGDAEEELLPNDSDLEERFGAAARARRAAAAAAAVGGQPVEAAGAEAGGVQGRFESSDEEVAPAQQQQQQQQPGPFRIPKLPPSQAEQPAKQQRVPPRWQKPSAAAGQANGRQHQQQPVVKAASSGSSQGATSAPREPEPQQAAPELAIKQEPGLELEQPPALQPPQQGQPGPPAPAPPAAAANGPAGPAGGAAELAGRPAVAADVFSGPSPASPVYEPVPRPHQGQQVPSPWVQQGNGGPQRGPRHAAASGSLQRQLSGSSGSRQQAGSGSRQGAQPAAAWHQQQAQQQPQAGQRQPPGHMQPPPHQPALYSPHNLSDCVISSKDLVEAVPIELALQSRGAGSLLRGLLVKLKKGGAYGLFRITHISPETGLMHYTLQGEPLRPARPAAASGHAPTEAEFEAYAAAQQAGRPWSVRKVAQLHWQRYLVGKWIQKVARDKGEDGTFRPGSLEAAVEVIANVDLRNERALAGHMERVQVAGPGGVPRSRAGQPPQQQARQPQMQQQGRQPQQGLAPPGPAQPSVMQQQQQQPQPQQQRRRMPEYQAPGSSGMQALGQPGAMRASDPRRARVQQPMHPQAQQPQLTGSVEEAAGPELSAMSSGGLPQASTGRSVGASLHSAGGTPRSVAQATAPAPSHGTTAPVQQPSQQRAAQQPPQQQPSQQPSGTQGARPAGHSTAPVVQQASRQPDPRARQALASLFADDSDDEGPRQQTRQPQQAPPPVHGAGQAAGLAAAAPPPPPNPDLGRVHAAQPLPQDQAQAPAQPPANQQASRQERWRQLKAQRVQQEQQAEQGPHGEQPPAAPEPAALPPPPPSPGVQAGAPPAGMPSPLPPLPPPVPPAAAPVAPAGEPADPAGVSAAPEAATDPGAKAKAGAAVLKKNKFTFLQQVEVVARSLVKQQAAEARAAEAQEAARAQAAALQAVASEAAPTAAPSGAEQLGLSPAMPPGVAPWAMGTAHAAAYPPTTAQAAAWPYAGTAPYNPYAAPVHHTQYGAAAQHAAMPYGYHSGAWPPHAFVAPAAGYQALPASYAAPTSYAAAPAAPAGYAAPPAAHSQEGGSGLVYSVAALDAHAGPPSISPVPPPQPVAASAAFGAADAVPVPTQQQQQPGGHTAAAVTPGRDEEEQGSAQAAATQAQGAEAAVEFSPAASPRDEHWHWDPVLALERRCLALLQQHGQQPDYQLLGLLRERGMGCMPPFLADAGEDDAAAVRRFVENRAHLFEVVRGDELRPTASSSDFIHLKQLLLDALYARRLRRAPVSELHALVLQEASDLVKLLPLKMAAQVQSLEAFPSFLTHHLGDCVWVSGAKGADVAELRPFDGSPDAAFLRQCPHQYIPRPDMLCHVGVRCECCHAPPRRESASALALRHNSGSNLNRESWARMLQRLCDERRSSGRGIIPPPEVELPTAPPSQVAGQEAAAAATAAGQQQQQRQQQQSSGSAVTSDAADHAGIWGLEPAGGTGQAAEGGQGPEVSSRMHASSSGATEDAANAQEGAQDAAGAPDGALGAADGPTAAPPASLPPAPWSHAAVEVVAAKAAGVPEPSAAAAAAAAPPSAVSPAAQPPPSVAVPSRTWQGTLQLEDGEEALQVTGHWCWPDGQPAKSTFVPVGYSLVLSEERECCDGELAAAAARWAALDAPCCALRPAATGANASEAEAVFETGLEIMAVAKSCGYLLELPGGRQLLVAPLAVVQAALELQAAGAAGAAQQALPPVLAQLAQQGAEAAEQQEHVLLALSLGTEGATAAGVSDDAAEEEAATPPSSGMRAVTPDLADGEDEEEQDEAQQQQPAAPPQQPPVRQQQQAEEEPKDSADCGIPPVPAAAQQWLPAGGVAAGKPVAPPTAPQQQREQQRRPSEPRKSGGKSRGRSRSRSAERRSRKRSDRSRSRHGRRSERSRSRHGRHSSRRHSRSRSSSRSRRGTHRSRRSSSRHNSSKKHSRSRSRGSSPCRSRSRMGRQRDHADSGQGLLLELQDTRFWDPAWQMERALVSKLLADGPQPEPVLHAMDIYIPPFFYKFEYESKEKAISRFIWQRSHLFAPGGASGPVALVPGAASFLVLKKRLLDHLARCPQQRARFRDLQLVVREAPALENPSHRDLAARDIRVFCRTLLGDCVWVFNGTDYCELRPFESCGGLGLQQPRQCETEHLRGCCHLGFDCPKCHAVPRGRGHVVSLVAARLAGRPG